MKNTWGATLFPLISLFAVAGSADAQISQEAHTTAEVIAVDKSWMVAEETGDVAYVDALLLPEYRSISPDGSTHSKEAILANTRKATPERAAMIKKYLVDHPTDMAVVINGDIAVLTFTAVNDAKKLILSCDIFAYRDGHWHALYSQHTDAEKA
jgi:hypothetical protein